MFWQWQSKKAWNVSSFCRFIKLCIVDHAITIKKHTLPRRYFMFCSCLEHVKPTYVGFFCICRFHPIRTRATYICLFNSTLGRFQDSYHSRRTIGMWLSLVGMQTIPKHSLSWLWRATGVRILVPLFLSDQYMLKQFRFWNHLT